MKNQYILRELKEKDAPFMLEWMHDENVTRDLQNDFAGKTIEDCLCFINKSKEKCEDLHFAIVDMNDEYMGTVSLKHVSDKTAEFAITIRQKAMGTGCSCFAMKKILDFGLRELNLAEVYWCVSPRNRRAVRFYNKHEYECIPISEMVVTKQKCLQFYSKKQLDEYIWYHVLGK